MATPSDRGRIVILVVDGEVVARNLAANRLHRDGYSVLAAAHGREALDLLRTYDGKIDLLIADTDIPKMDSLELCEAALTARPGIKICTMSGNPSHQERALNSGVPFVLKPLDPEFLRRQFEDVLI